MMTAKYTRLSRVLANGNPQTSLLKYLPTPTNCIAAASNLLATIVSEPRTMGFLACSLISRLCLLPKTFNRINREKQPYSSEFDEITWRNTLVIRYYAINLLSLLVINDLF